MQKINGIYATAIIYSETAEDYALAQTSDAESVISRLKTPKSSFKNWIKSSEKRFRQAAAAEKNHIGIAGILAFLGGN